MLVFKNNQISKVKGVKSFVRQGKSAVKIYANSSHLKILSRDPIVKVNNLNDYVFIADPNNCDSNLV